MPASDERVVALLRDRAESFWARVAVGGPDECWDWLRAKTDRGYGRVTFSAHGFGATFPTHRVAYMIAKGPIPDGLEIDHLCRTVTCCNPDHLEPVTREENMRRRNAAHGPSGSIEIRHLMTGTRWRVRWREGGRQCVKTFTTEAEAIAYLAQQRAA